MKDSTLIFVVILAALVLLAIVLWHSPKSSRRIELPQLPSRQVEPERYSTTTPPRYESVEKVLGRLENTFHLTGIPQSENIPEMVVGLGTGPGILGNMRNPSEGIYLNPNTGVF